MIHKEDFEELLEHAPDSVIVINTEGKIIFVNKQTERIFNYPKEELINRSIELLIPERFGESHIHYRNNYLKTPSTRPMGHPGLNLMGKRKTNEEFPVEISLSPIYTSENNKLLVIASIRDISSRVEMENEIKEAKSLFQRIFESSIHGIIQLKATYNANQEVENFIYTLINKRGEELLGKSKDEIMEKYVTDIFPGIKSRATFSILCEVVKNGNTQIHEVITNINGTEKWFKASYIKMDSGILISFDDISIRKLAQKKLEDLNIELEKGVSERTKELAAANERLITINEKLDKYAYLISHDIKSPINNILGLAEFIRTDYDQKVFDEEGKVMINLIIDKCNDIKLIVDNLLQTAKDEIKSKELVNLNAVTNAVIETLNPPDNFHFLIQQRLPKIKYPKASIIQILQNLFSNAIKYMDKEPPLISLTCNEIDNTYLLCVTDNGPGIEEEKQKTIFDLFETAHEEKEVKDSYGIGLSIVRQLVEENGGKIWVESVPGEGSKFHFTIPK